MQQAFITDFQEFQEALNNFSGIAKDHYGAERSRIQNHRPPPRST